MHGKAHLTAGVLTGVITTAMLWPIEYKMVPIVVGASAIGGLAPDIDLPKSTLGRIIKPVSFLINKMFGHRTITHTLFWLIPIIYGIIHFRNGPSPTYVYGYYALLGFLSGFLSHMCGDLFTSGGISPVYPLSRKRIKVFKNKSGKADKILVFMICTIWIAGAIVIRQLF